MPAPGAGMSRDVDLAFAHSLADAADAITLARFRSLDLVVETKPDLTPVSEADRAAEHAIRDLVARGRPGEGVLGEELGDDGAAAAGSSTRSTGRSTTCAASRCGRRCWRSSGEAGRGRRRVGACARPPLVGSARRGRLGRRRALPGVAGGANRGLRQSRRRPRARCHRDGRSSRVARGRCADSATSGSTAWSPKAPSMSRPTESWALWDYAAVALIVEEAGGRCTTFEGDTPMPDRSLLSTNGMVHDEVRALLSVH